MDFSGQTHFLIYLSILIVYHPQIFHFYFLWLFACPKSCHCSIYIFVFEWLH